MTTIADVTCINLECKKKQECWRYMREISEHTPIDFKSICGNFNDYHYIYNIGDKPVRKEKLK